MQDQISSDNATNNFLKGHLKDRLGHESADSLDIIDYHGGVG